MTLKSVMGKGTFSIGLGIIIASALQLGADLVQFGNVNLSSQFPYPWGPPIGSAFLLGVGIALVGLMILILRPSARQHA